MIRLILILSAAALLGWLALGQVLGGPDEPPVRTTLAAIMANPSIWEGRTVTVAGNVSDRASILGLGTLTLADGTGRQILVLGHISAPDTGAPVDITGRFLTAYAIGQTTLPVIVVLIFTQN